MKRVWTEQCPSTGSAGALTLRRLEAAPDLVGIPDDHLVERHAHLERGVASEVLVGSMTSFSPRSHAHVITAAALVDVQTMPPCSPQKALMAADD